MNLLFRLVIAAMDMLPFSYDDAYFEIAVGRTGSRSYPGVVDSTWGFLKLIHTQPWVRWLGLV